MKFFLDTANIEDIKKYVAWGVVDGVTTNPTLIAREGADLETRIKEIAGIVDGPVSAEVTSTTYSEMVDEGRRYASWHPNVYVKIPITTEGIQAIKTLSDEGIRVNTTLVFSTGQALLAAKAGAKLISPFIGRLDDIGADGMSLIQEMAEMCLRCEYDTEVLVASIRSPRHVIEAAQLKAQVATIPPAVMEKLIKHPLTDSGQEQFLADWNALQSDLKGDK